MNTMGISIFEMFLEQYPNNYRSMAFYHKILYHPGCNKLLRTISKPFVAIIPAKYHFPVTGIISLGNAEIPSFKMKTNPTNGVTRILFWKGIEGFEYNAARVFIKLAKKSSLFFDIGSNIGYYSLLASSLTQKKLRICAFEPMAPIYDFLKQNIALNNFENITPCQIALSDSEGEAEFYSISNPKFPDMAQLTGDGGLSLQHSGSRSRQKFNVKVTTLDLFVNTHYPGQKIDLIKLDTEAHEHFVLKGAEEVLKTHRPIIQCEIIKDMIEREIEAIVSPHNYLFFLTTNEGLKEVKTLSQDKISIDFYLVPAEKKHIISEFLISDNK
jgi:FkbM family methyltransferase